MSQKRPSAPVCENFMTRLYHVLQYSLEECFCGTTWTAVEHHSDVIIINCAALRYLYLFLQNILHRLQPQADSPIWTPSSNLLAKCGNIMLSVLCLRSARRELEARWPLGPGVQGLLKAKGPRNSRAVDALWCYHSHICYHIQYVPPKNYNRIFTLITFK